MLVEANLLSNLQICTSHEDQHTCAGLFKAGFRDHVIGFSLEHWQKSNNTYDKLNSFFPCTLIISLYLEAYTERRLNIHCPVCSLAMTPQDLTLSYQAVIPLFY